MLSLNSQDLPNSTDRSVLTSLVTENYICLKAYVSYYKFNPNVLFSGIANYFNPSLIGSVYSPSPPKWSNCSAVRVRSMYIASATRYQRYLLPIEIRSRVFRSDDQLLVSEQGGFL